MLIAFEVYTAFL